MNWGYKIIIVYAVFVAGILFLVFRSVNEKIDLVTDDYYAQELKYQDRIEDIKRSNKLSAEVICKTENDKVFIKFPSEFNGKNINGKLLIYFPADKEKDIHKNFTTTNAELEQTLAPNTKGAYSIQINWSCGGENYYFEKKIFIQ
ncbi:MAG: FixH family protein [Bacteroidota bacterium]|nr:FixH family protein [Bacteroidota bacterium]